MAKKQYMYAKNRKQNKTKLNNISIGDVRPSHQAKVYMYTPREIGISISRSECIELDKIGRRHIV